MTSIEKLNKIIDSLRGSLNLANPDPRREDGKQLSKKDKISNLHLVYDNLIAAHVKQSDEYSKSLSLAVETFLAYIDDEDQDVYFVAEECLNKTIKQLLDANLARFPADLYRYMRKNGAERSLRTALIRFAELSHLIKPHKCRVYVDFFIRDNTLGQIASRSEESIQNALVPAMNKICQALCWSMSDNEVKSLIQSFLPNLSNTSPVNSYRRVSANCLSIICLYSRSPYNSFHYLHEELLKLIFPLEEGYEDPNKKFTIWGVLLCFRFMIMHLAELDKCSLISSSSSNHPSLALYSPSVSYTDSLSSGVQKPIVKPKKLVSYFNLFNLCQIYEVCIYYLSLESGDNRILTASLECLQVLLKLQPFKFNLYMTRTTSHDSTIGINDSFLHKFYIEFMQQRSSMTTSMSSTSTGNMLDNKLSGSMDSLNTLKPVSQNEETRSIVDESAVPQSTTVETTAQVSTLQSQQSFGEPPILYHPVKRIDPDSIGSFYDTKQNPPVVYFARLLCYKFLLRTSIESVDEKSKLKSDTDVKVIVKSVALECCSNAVAIYPSLLFKTVYSDTSYSVYIYDLLGYVNHTDDKMRSNACLLIGHLIRSVLSVEKNSGKVSSFNHWVSRMSSIHPGVVVDSLRLEALVANILSFIPISLDTSVPKSLSNTNNICKRFAVCAIHAFLPTLFKSRHSYLALNILINLTHMKNANYNLIKCELVDLVASIDFKAVSYVEDNLAGLASKQKKRKRLSDDENQPSVKLDSLGSNEFDNESDCGEEEDDEEDDDEDEDDQTFTKSSPFQTRHVQTRLMEDVLLYLLNTDDVRLRVETARAITRFVYNMSSSSSTNSTSTSTLQQNLLLAHGEHWLKNHGAYASNIFTSSLVDDSLCHLINSPLVQHQSDSQLSSLFSLTSVLSPTNILHNPKKQMKYQCSPLSSLSLGLSLPWLSKSAILNNTFIQPFHSLIKHWPSNASTSGTVSNSLNVAIEHNLNQVVHLLLRGLLESIDKSQFLGYLETMDFLFQVYEPAIYYASNPNSNQLLELLTTLISLLRHPHISFDMYAHDLVLRLVSSLNCSYAWLNMRKLDKLTQEIQFNLSQYHSSSNNNTATNLIQQQQSVQVIKSLLDTLSNATLKSNSNTATQSQAELETGLANTYMYTLAFGNMSSRACMDQLFVHAAKMLCVLACVVDENALPSQLTYNLSHGSASLTGVAPPPPAPLVLTTTSTTSTTNSPANLTQTSPPPTPASASSTTSSSPGFLKSKFSSITDSKLLSKNQSSTASTSSLASTSTSSTNSKSSAVNTKPNDPNSTLPPLPTQPNVSLPKTTTNIYLGSFQNSSHYLKIYENLKLLYNSYKKSPNLGGYDKFVQILRTTLNSFAQLLESALSVHEVGPHLDELLLYLRILFTIEPSCSVKCVTLCLKSLFGLNLGGLMHEYIMQQLNRANMFIIQVNNAASQRDDNSSATFSASNNTSYKPNHSRSNSNTNVNNNLIANSASQSTIPQVSLSGYSSVLSTSMNSLASVNAGVLSHSTTAYSFNPNIGNNWNSRRQKTSLFTNVIETKFNQFSKFMYMQSLMFRNDSLSGLQINQAIGSNMANLGFDSIEYVTTTATSMTKPMVAASIINQSTTTPSTQQNSSPSVATKQPTSQATAAATSSGFNIFGFMKKNKDNSSKSSLSATSTSSGISSISSSLNQPHNQQQQLIEQQQQKLKQQRTDLKTISQYIKSFESIVIKSLRQYTLTTSVNLQAKILELLVQLIFLKVDYCLLDSDKVFIDYVLKQFEYLEQNKTSSTSTTSSNQDSYMPTGVREEETGAQLLSKSYLFDLYESFDSESTHIDPLSPFDLSTRLNKLFSYLHSSYAYTLGASSSGNAGAGSSSGGSSGSAGGSNTAIYSTMSTTPICSNLSLKIQEHQQNHLIIPKLFDFLILLSHEKKTPSQNQQSKPTIPGAKIGGMSAKSSLLTIPEIMQLCDNLIASENSPHTHAIPALRPLVVDLFLNRGPSLAESSTVTNYLDKELDMQQDVIMMTMLRLIQYPQVWPLLTIAVSRYKTLANLSFSSNQTLSSQYHDKWKKCSRQVCDALFDSMRASNLRLRFGEFNGAELRSTRRYSNSHVPYIQSLKQLLVLVNSLSPQVFRPVDFVLLSLFETCKVFFFKSIDTLSTVELNNSLCILLFHLYVLLSHSTEDQLLIRLFNLIPQIISSYQSEEQLPQQSMDFSAFQKKPTLNPNVREAADHNHPLLSSTTSSTNTDEEDHTSSITSTTTSTSSSSKQRPTHLTSDDFDLEDENEPDDYESEQINLNESALFMSQFLLKIYENVFQHVVKTRCKFGTSCDQNSDLTASSSFLTAQPGRDFKINLSRELNYTEQLLVNKLMFLLYTVNSGHFNRVSVAICLLVNDKIKSEKDETDETHKSRIGSESCSSIESGGETSTHPEYSSSSFNFDSSQFTYKINKLILQFYARSNPYFSSMWQYFLMSCNYQDSEYWLASFGSASYSKKAQNRINNLDDVSSTLSSLSYQPSRFSKKETTKAKSNVESKEKSQIGFPRQPTLNETLFRYLSLTIYCDYLTNSGVTNGTVPDNTTGLTMVIINNLVELLELSISESSVLALLGVVHRNSAASSLFIMSINNNWPKLVKRKKLYLLHACLKALEGVHLSSSGQLLNLLVDRFFHLPYLSLVRYADHIACQRVEMLQSIPLGELGCQLTEENIKFMSKFFHEQFKYSYRHRRLISLLDQLKKTIDQYNQDQSSNSLIHQEVTSEENMGGIKPSASIDFFMLYTSPALANSNASLDKEWFYNMVRSACCSTIQISSMSSTSTTGTVTVSGNSHPLSNTVAQTPATSTAAASTFLNSKQCALMLSNLDSANILSIMQDKQFRIGLLKDCLLLGAHKTQQVIDKLPGVFRTTQSLNTIQSDFIHPLWSSGVKFLFENVLSYDNDENTEKIWQHLTVPTGQSSQDMWRVYESRIVDMMSSSTKTLLIYDLHDHISPITESINAYLKSIHQYPCLKPTENLSAANNNNLIQFVLFQIDYISFLINKQDSCVGNAAFPMPTIQTLNQSLMAIFNLLSDSDLLYTLCEQRTDYSSLITRLIQSFYSLLIRYFFTRQDENLISIPSVNIVYGNNIQSDMLFNVHTLNLMLKLRFILTSHRYTSQLGASSTTGSSSTSGNGSSEALGVNNSGLHTFLQPHYFRSKIPMNLRDLCDKIYLSMCRLPILDRFMRIPESMWRMGGSMLSIDYSQLFKNDSSTLPPLDYLRDPIILRDHLRHVLSVGWTSRSQFEYEYVNLLTLLHNLSEDYYLPMSTGNRSSSLMGESILSNSQLDYSLSSNASSTSSGPNESNVITGLPVEEIRERNKSICLVIKALSSWLIKSSLAPRSGNSLSSLYEQVGRNKIPSFLNTKLGKQYCQIKTTIESFNRSNQFTRLNSVSLTNNTNLLYMLDPVQISEFDRKYKQQQQLQQITTNNLISQQDSLNQLIQISTSLSQRDQFNQLFSTNIERLMISNSPTNVDSYYYFTQISLEGLLKFMGQWNREFQSLGAAGAGGSQRNLAEAIFNNLVSSGNSAVDEVSTKTANALNSIIRLAENLTGDDTNKQSFQFQTDQPTINVSQLPGPSFISGQTMSNVIQRSFNRNNLDIASVLRTVLDYYESFFKNPSLQLKLDIFRSMIYLGNTLFDSKQQYESIMNKLTSNFDLMNSFIQLDLSSTTVTTTSTSTTVNVVPNTPNQPSIITSTTTTTIGGDQQFILNELIDESVIAIGIYAECLCRCTLQASKFDSSSSMSSKDFDRLNKLFENGFRSNSVGVKIATVQGLMYWLESITLGYVGGNNDARLLTDHLCKQINQLKDLGVYATTNWRYISTLWSAVFYAIENCLDSIRDAQNFVSTFIKQTYHILNDPNAPFFLFYQLYMGLERFLLSNMLPSFEINTIQRLFSSKFYDDQRSMCLVSLISTSLYASTNQQGKIMNYWNDLVMHTGRMNKSQSFLSPGSLATSPMTSGGSNDDNPIMESLSGSRRASVNESNNASSSIQVSGYPQILELSAYPDLQSHLLKVLEVATNFLDRMKACSTTKEASLYASILPKMLCDFLPPHDLLNKLITEFLNSSQHPYPEAIAYILYKCFDLLQEKGLQMQIQEWCLLSLCNFLQRATLAESIWLTSCLLVSATKNQWLKSTFPFLLNRYCAFETVDRAIFYMSVIEFCKQFNDKTQLHTIYTTFESIAKPGTPYEELIKLLGPQINS